MQQLVNNPHRQPIRTLAGRRLAVCAIVILAAPLAASGQFSSDWTDATDRWRGIGMEEFWRTQTAADGGSTFLQYAVPHVSSSEFRTVFEVVVGDTRRAFVPEMVDRWGAPLGETGAARQADIERRVLEAQGLQARIDKRDFRNCSLYLQTNTSVLQAIDAETGQSRWSLMAGSRAAPAAAPGVSDQAVASVVGTTLSVISPIDGTVLWNHRLTGIPAGEVAIGKDLVFVPRLRGGVELISLTATDELPRYVMSSGFATGGITSWGSQWVAWPTSLGYLYVADAESGAVKYRIETRSPVVQSPRFAADGTLCLVTDAGMIIAAHPKNGAIRWQFMTGDLIVQPPMVFQDVVCVVTAGGELVCVELANGALRWRRAGVQAWAGVAAEKLLAVDQQQDLIAIELVRGDQVGQSALDGLNLLVSQVVSDRMYLTSRTGEVIALRPVGTLWPTIYAPALAPEPAAGPAVTPPETPVPTTPAEAPATPSPPTPAETAPDTDTNVEEDPFAEDNPFETGDEDNPFEGE